MMSLSQNTRGLKKKKAKEVQKPARVQVTKVGGWREHKDEQCHRHTLKRKRNKQGKTQRSALVCRYLKSLTPVTYSKSTRVITKCHGFISNRSAQKPIWHCLLLQFKSLMNPYFTSALWTIFRMLFKSYSTSGWACVRQHRTSVIILNLHLQLFYQEDLIDVIMHMAVCT